jgi:hypothetical protein
MFLPRYGQSLCLDMVNHCAMLSIGQTWVLASIGAVVEMGILSTLKRLLMESTEYPARNPLVNHTTTKVF